MTTWRWPPLSVLPGNYPAWFHQLRLRCTFVRCERRFQPHPCHVLPNVEAHGGGELVADVVVEADADRHGNWLSCGGTVFALIILLTCAKVSMVSLGRASLRGGTMDSLGKPRSACFCFPRSSGSRALRRSTNRSLDRGSRKGLRRVRGRVRGGIGEGLCP